MADYANADEPFLDDIPEKVEARCKSYDELDLLQQYAMFMGKAQILELVLKNVLAQRFEYDHGKMEKWTLGKIRVEMAASGVRPDFITYLENLTDLRNFVAHELLASEMMLLEVARKTGRLNKKHLYKAIYELEQLLLIVEWTEQNDGWT